MSDIKCKTSPQFTTTITSCLPPVALSSNHHFQQSSSSLIVSYERIADEERTKCRRKITVRNVLIADIDADQTCNACPEFAVLTFKQRKVFFTFLQDPVLVKERKSQIVLLSRNFFTIDSNRITC